MTALSGGLTLFIGVILMFLVFAILFLPMETAAETAEVFGTEMQMIENSITAQKKFGKVYDAGICVLSKWMLLVISWGILAAVTMSKYMAYASPFILYYVLVIFSKRYFKIFICAKSTRMDKSRF